MSIRFRPRQALATFVPTILALTSPLAGAQPVSDPLTVDPQARPFIFGVSQGFAYDSNVFRVAPGTPRESDVQSITGLHAGFNHRLSRQHLFANVGFGLHRFQDLDALNHTSTSLNTGINWSTIGDLGGTLRYAQNRSLADYATPGAAAITDRNIEQTQLVEFTARRPISVQTAMRIGLEHRRVDFSSDSYQDREYRHNVYSIGLEHGLERSLRLGIGFRYTDGRTPRFAETAPGVYTADDNKRRDIDLTTEWDPGGRSTLSARLSYTRDDHSAPALADFSGLTGSLGWRHAMTGKLAVTADLQRDTGAETRFADFTGGTPTQAVDTNRITNSIRAGLSYNPTAKIETRASYRHARGKMTAPLGGSGHDTTRTIALGVRYDITRSIELGCDVEQERRSSNTALSSAYRFTTAYCAAQLVMR